MLSGLSRKVATASLTRSTTAHNASGATRTFAKEIKFGIEGRAAMLKGVDTLADAVQVCPISLLLRIMV
jgi:chaperonin GroEL